MAEDDCQDMRRWYDADAESRLKMVALFAIFFDDLAKLLFQEAAQNGIGPGSKDRA